MKVKSFEKLAVLCVLFLYEPWVFSVLILICGRLFT